MDFFNRQTKCEFIDIIYAKMNEEEFWNFIKSWATRDFLIKLSKRMTLKNKKETIKKYKLGEYKTSYNISLKDCQYLDGAPTTGGGLSYFYHPKTKSIIEVGYDDSNNITFHSTPLIKFLRSIEVADNFLLLSLLKLEQDTIITRKTAIIDRQICVECGDSVIFGSGKFVNRIPVLDDDQQKIQNNHPFWWGEYICYECDIKIRKEIT